ATPRQAGNSKSWGGRTWASAPRGGSPAGKSVRRPLLAAASGGSKLRRFRRLLTIRRSPRGRRLAAKAAGNGLEGKASWRAPRRARRDDSIARAVVNRSAGRRAPPIPVATRSPDCGKTRGAAGRPRAPVRRRPLVG